jgi:threonine synthase
METALPVKFAEVIREALGKEPPLPKGLETLESLPQRVTVVDPDAETVKRYIEKHAA